MESQNMHLQETNDNRASMRDLNATRPSNYLNAFLERVTEGVKVPKNHVLSKQVESEIRQSQDMADSSLAF